MIFVFAFMLLYTMWPMKELEAAKLLRFMVFNGGKSYLIAGEEYGVLFEEDLGLGTVSIPSFEYSVDNGGIWHPMYHCKNDSCFRLPIDPELTSAIIRLDVVYIPIFGSNTHSEMRSGPYKILQPADPSDINVTPKDDGTVELTWNDNSNMESSYRITRYGPDGTKTFYVNNTMDHRGPLSYIDNQTDKYKSTLYNYSLSMVIDKYDLPEELQPSIFNKLVKTKVPISIVDKVKISPNIPDVIVPDKTEIDPNSKIINKFKLNIIDFDKIAIASLSLNKHSIELKPGQTEKLTVAATNAGNQKIVWSSNNPQIAVVDNDGSITAKSPGMAKIMVKTESESLSDSCDVNVTLITQTPEPAILKDIAGHKANAEIMEAVALGFVSGYPDGTFKPDANVTRAEFATMLMKALQSQAVADDTTMNFADVDQIGSWAREFVSKAVKLKIIEGYDDLTFRPNANISHAEMIAMVIRASGLRTDNAKPTSFADAADIPPWANPSVSKAAETGIIIVGGLPDNKFAPQALSTRAEAASAIVRMLKVKK
ncbi:S-layer homology domain-containing protein [Paenibacillus planticolens]|nr:S-layer homology domain-containing protein [Paenibacillus planticolens]